MAQPLTFLCITCYFKGEEFIRACHEQGNRVILITDKKLEADPWPRDAISETYYMEEDQAGNWDLDHLRAGIAWLMRKRRIDRIIALDDFDVEKAAAMREEFRIPGMGDTTARHFRDKLAMRMKATEQGIRVPPFSALFNDDDINAFADRVAPPWVIKPRGEASATGIRKVSSREELWEHIQSLGDRRIHYLVEQFKPGDVYHVDALSVDGKLLFCRSSAYLSPPFEVAHGGGIFRSAVLEFGCPDDLELQKLTDDVMKGFGMKFSASHTEFIKSREDGQFYFLETSSRVGGAHLSDMVEQSAGINLWSEWARIEDAMARGTAYSLPEVRKDYAGIIVSLSREEWPDYKLFSEPELAWTLKKKHHVGLIVRSDKRERILELLDRYAELIRTHFHASLPPPEKSAH